MASCSSIRFHIPTASCRRDRPPRLMIVRGRRRLGMSGSYGIDGDKGRTAAARSDRWLGLDLSFPLAPDLLPISSARSRRFGSLDDLVHEPELVEHRSGQDERIRVLQPHTRLMRSWP